MTRSSPRPETLILTFTDCEPFARQLATASNLACEVVDLHRFPDGESLVRLPDSLADHVVFCRSLDQPNAKLVELMLAAVTARDLGAHELSQCIIGRFLAQYFDTVITVDPHLHRINDLSQAIPLPRCFSLSAAAPIAAFISQQRLDPILVGPDEESEQWLKAIAARLSCPYCCARKQRSGDHEVAIELPTGDYHARDIILIDDVASTGQTLITAAQVLRPCRPASINVMVTHALFADETIGRMRHAGISHIWSTNSITHPSNVVSLTELLADFLRTLD